MAGPHATEETSELKTSLKQNQMHSVNMYVHEMLGDQGSYEETDEDQTNDVNRRKRKQRKRLGVYPRYRTRYNGVKWACESSDEEICSSRGVSRCGFRRSKKLGVANTKGEYDNVVKCNSESTCDGENEESGPQMMALQRWKKKAHRKCRSCIVDFNSTSSEASDVESLTDCSLNGGDIV